MAVTVKRRRGERVERLWRSEGVGCKYTVEKNREKKEGRRKGFCSLSHVEIGEEEDGSMKKRKSQVIVNRGGGRDEGGGGREGEGKKKAHNIVENPN